MEVCADREKGSLHPKKPNLVDFGDAEGILRVSRGRSPPSSPSSSFSNSSRMKTGDELALDVEEAPFVSASNVLSVSFFMCVSDGESGTTGSDASGTPFGTGEASGRARRTACSDSTFEAFVIGVLVRPAILFFRLRLPFEKFPGSPMSVAEVSFKPDEVD